MDNRFSNIFKVSTDYLLGVDITKQEKDIFEIIEKAKAFCDNSKYNDAVILLRNALIQYPSSCEIMYWLAWSLRGTIRQHPEHEHEAINIYRRILNISKNSELICKVTRDLAYCYYTLGDVQTAKAHIDMLPSFDVCREYNLGRSNVLSGKELAKILQNNIRTYAGAIQESLEYFSNETVLKESEMAPYSLQRATKDLAIIKDFLK